MPLSREPQEDPLDAARQIARLVVESFLGDQEYIGIDDSEDLVEILVEHWWIHGKAFEQDGSASRDTYMRVVFRHKLLDLTDAARTAKRGLGAPPRSVESPVNPQDPECDTALAETIVDQGFEADVEWICENDELRRALADLRPYLANDDWQLLEALHEDPRVRPASKRLGVHHSTAYARLARIRRAAEDRGLRRFLESDGF